MIWKLEPINSSSEAEANRRYCTYAKTVFVRADSAERARQIAWRSFTKLAKPEQRWERELLNPWELEVSAAVVDDSGYPQEGKEEVVGPPEALRCANHSFFVDC